MGHIIQFGIPSLDSLIGKPGVVLLRDKDIVWDKLIDLFLSPNDSNDDSDFPTDERRKLLSEEKAPDGLRKALEELRDAKEEDLKIRKRLEILVTLNSKLAAKQGAYSCWNDLNETARNGSKKEPERLRRLDDYLRYRDDEPADEDLQDLPLRNRLVLDVVLGPIIAQCRHEIEGWGFSIPEAGEHSTDRAILGMATTSLCILGPDGTGKSVIALHLASRFAADSSPCTRIFYASTDLSYEMAQEKWEKFGLDFPNARTIPFHDMEKYTSWRSSEEKKGLQAKLVKCSPIGYADDLIPDGSSRSLVPEGFKEPAYLRPSVLVSRYMLREDAPEHEGTEKSRKIAFIDLAGETAGDDWGYLNRVVADLEVPTGADRHLLIVDAVEGLETLVGEQDAHGQKRSRRSRIAQLLRLATGKCHVAFIVEEPRDNERLPEEFVADVVIRLRTVPEHGYSNRSVEIVKARGQENVRGQHRIIIRSGEGSTTGKQINSDEPHNKLVGHGPERTQSYFHVVHSLHNLSRVVMKRARRKDEQAIVPDGSPEVSPSEETGGAGFAGFGIPTLDEMLGPAPIHDKEHSLKRGFPRGSISALIGDDGTHKSRLGRAFLSGCFIDDSPKHPEVAVLLTTSFLDAENLTELLIKHQLHPLQSTDAELEERERKLEQSIKQRIICRRLEVHALSSASLIHIIRCAVEQAKEKLEQAQHKYTLSDDQQKTRIWPRGERHPNADHIRLVIDDWSNIKDTYPGVADDPLFLPFLKFYLERERITTLIIDTQPGGPEHIVKEEIDRELRALVNHHIYTWNVPFFGERRVAITAVPPVVDGMPVAVRELRPAGPSDGERMEVDPHFELYTGLEVGKPESVPLQINLFAETEGLKRYVKQSNDLFSRLFVPRENQQIIQGEDPSSYERSREFRYLQGDTRMEHTLVFQVDEFWTDSPSLRVQESSRKSEPNNPARRRLEADYLTQETIDCHGKPLPFADPYRVFAHYTGGDVSQKTEDMSRSKGRERHRFFNVLGYGSQSESELTKDRARGMDRVPFMWDFGFLLVRRDAWDAFFYRLAGQPGRPSVDPKFWERLKSHDKVSWREFFEASRDVAMNQSRPGETPISAFDMDMLGLETFSSLVLEVWTSEIHRDVIPSGLTLPTLRDAKRECGLVELMENSHYHEALYRTWLILGEVINPSRFEIEDFELKTREADPSAVAARHWYSTACDITRKYSPNGELVPIALPGRYCVRGDWFLAVASGSRSTRLGFQAIDLLSSRRANAARLSLGAGLPVRDMFDLTTVPFSLKNKRSVQDDLPLSRTPLWKIPCEGSEKHLTYGELLKIGARCYEKTGDEHVSWLWRSRLKDYDRHARVWSRWLCRLLVNWQGWRQEDNSPLDGFALYDQQTPGSYNNLNSYRKFTELCQVLEIQLRAATAKN